MCQPRYYRSWVKNHELTGFQVVCEETDLLVLAESNLQTHAIVYATKYHSLVRQYLAINSNFGNSLVPIPDDETAPPIIRSMIEAAQKAGVGPMAAVAGAISEFTGKDLLAHSKEVIVENGGDIFLKTSRKRVVSIYAGSSPLSGKIGIVIRGDNISRGICTSSGTVGHSLSFGKADAAVALSDSAILADAAATAIGNVVKAADDIPASLEIARSIPGITGALIIVGSKLGAWGDVCLTRLEP
ncbi:MAG: UPF0280 family protein [Dehalococcoidales bacterium]|jgi:ApbE superfamily uncharacterized protein (UPF0280 family)|nr:UPF0280 family protein [Dehalococcoidales bacterium]MDD3265541.1 UPF0280 family protein [Dehalococcoidales bacterium]MDD4322640.1 UPF0280 family protein [Dehalococcoidales bacterium]MDD4794915.1 UPF0280 family protein [Dehalococcoidales bacterium]MDX9803940.1 UPF0280 family protein [Dehalococcoidales bacterium]